MSNPEPPPRQASVAAPAVGLGGAVVLLLAGGWLMFAPFAFGYQPSGADWTDATTTDFYTGIGIAAAALLAGVALAAQVAGRVRAPDRPHTTTDVSQGDDVTPEEPPVEETWEPEATAAAPSDASEVATVLTPLVEALIHDLSASPEAPAPTRNGSYQQVTGGERS